jgi:hypothetical protein
MKGFERSGITLLGPMRVDNFITKCDAKSSYFRMAISLWLIKCAGKTGLSGIVYMQKRRKVSELCDRFPNSALYPYSANSSVNGHSWLRDH